ncbi:MAG: helix-turn-helix domain-containing protein [Defluviitaleaceae bacterium]|nr:helix-turn-helix domain-containing protein [Defluviitaleaceae bacterium]
MSALSKEMLKTSIDGLKKITHKDITVRDREGNILATTLTTAQPPNATTLETPDFTLIVHDDDCKALRFGELAVFHLQTLSAARGQHHDIGHFLKDLLLGVLSDGDISHGAKKFRIQKEARRVVYLIEAAASCNAAEILRELFPDRKKDLIARMDDTSIVLIREIKEAKETNGNEEQTARSIVDTLGSEAMSRVYTAIGKAFLSLEQAADSYRSARIAQEAGKLFESEKQIISYQNLGIARLIYEMPPPLCRLFIDEVFKIESLDESLFATITKFFENDLNITETARALFVHRNTLIYRLDKIQQLTGLDLRRFGDAITFKIGLMVESRLRKEF